jgi:hypothetical protein
MATCPGHDGDCTRGCSDEACKLACATAASHCLHLCTTASNERCEAAGLARLGLCASLAQLDATTAASDNRITTLAAGVESQAQDRAMFDALQATSQACEVRCRRATSSMGLTSCLLACAARVREQCEHDARQPDIWCKSLRIQEDALHQAQDLLERQARDAHAGT